MQKFSELVYIRPDVAALADSIRAYTAALPKAAAGLSNPFAEGTVAKIIGGIVDDLKL